MALLTKDRAFLTRLANKGDVYAKGILEAIKGEDAIGGGGRVEVILKNPAAASATSCVTAKAANLASNSLTIAAQPDFPRTVLATFQASYDGGDIVIVGVDHTGLAATETLASNAGGTTAGTIAWKSITTVSKSAVGATTNTVSVGYQDTFGLGAKPLKELSILCFVDGVAAAPTAVELTKGTVSPATASNGAHDYLLSAIKV